MDRDLSGPQKPFWTQWWREQVRKCAWCNISGASALLSLNFHLVNAPSYGGLHFASKYDHLLFEWRHLELSQVSGWGVWLHDVLTGCLAGDSQKSLPTAETHVKCPLLSPDFNQYWNMFTNFSRTTRWTTVQQFRRTGRHGEVKRSVLERLVAKAPKNCFPLSRHQTLAIHSEAKLFTDRGTTGFG